MWWELGSLGELTILEAEGGALVGSVQLAHVQHVGRTKGPEYYELCVDIDVEGPGDEEERTITLRPPGREAMEAWLRALSEQVESTNPNPNPNPTPLPNQVFDSRGYRDVGAAQVSALEALLL